ncbi:hypothetical protein C2E21_5322 [Chlorella sorokiniana]|uniref:Alpha-ketoglutarate-dependent dioxygenase AlkB-like domain-containing protein n=1 Tax=Chlorella sorokiniana TaxID=3076 RepID=A0A2P6TP67_CHLSO|nr:hypothetical protein C2E21_5322 [Chlorella sorokiniana]|eukprot:PRW51125.1 hypothetical protein C2E21_5322 [Chlorella sorokiniana]
MSYPKHSGIGPHYDDEAAYGELLIFAHGYAPGYQHSIESVGTVGGQPPFWNPFGERRSITLRSTKAYALSMLRCELAARPASQQQRRTSVQQRLQALQGKPGFALPSGQACGAVRSLPVQRALALWSSPLAAARLPARDALFVQDLPLRLAALYPGYQPPAQQQPQERQQQQAVRQPSTQAAALPQPVQVSVPRQVAGGGPPMNAAAAQLGALEGARQARRQQGQQAQQTLQAQQQERGVMSLAGRAAGQRVPAAVAAGAAALARAGGLGRRQQQVGAAAAPATVQVVDLTEEDEKKQTITSASAATAGASRKRAEGASTSSPTAKQQRQQQRGGTGVAADVISLLSDESDGE